MKEIILMAALEALSATGEKSFMESLYDSLDTAFEGTDREGLMMVAYQYKEDLIGLILSVYLNRTKKVTAWMNLVGIPLEYDENIEPDQVFKLPLGHTLNTLGVRYFVK